MPKLRSLIQQIKVGGFSAFVSLLRSNLYKVDHCLRLELDLSSISAALPSISCPSNYHLRRASEVDLHQLRAVRSDPPLPQDFFEDHIHGLKLAYVGCLSEELVHILWLACAGEPSTVSGFVMKTGEAEMRNVITLSAYRGRGILTYSVKAAVADMKVKGFQRVYAHIAETNVASLKGFRSAGFSTTRRVVIRRVLGWDHVVESPAPVPKTSGP